MSCTPFTSLIPYNRQACAIVCIQRTHADHSFSHSIRKVVLANFWELTQWHVSSPRGKEIHTFKKILLKWESIYLLRWTHNVLLDNIADYLTGKGKVFGQEKIKSLLSVSPKLSTLVYKPEKTLWPWRRAQSFLFLQPFRRYYPSLRQKGLDRGQAVLENWVYSQLSAINTFTTKATKTS